MGIALFCVKHGEGVLQTPTEFPGKGKIVRLRPFRHRRFFVPYTMSLLRAFFSRFPAQYWLMTSGVFLSTLGGSMIGPFLLIYASQKSGLPLRTVASLVSINAATGLVASLLAGSLADRFGRKGIMNLSLTVNALAYLLMRGAESYPEFAALMILTGLFSPLYQVGADAMLADLIPSEQRADAYAITRVVNNAAFAIGPAIGGFMAARSYDLAFLGLFSGLMSYSLMLFFLGRETLRQGLAADSDAGYTQVLRDGHYLLFIALLSLGLIAPSLLWILLSVYVKTHFGIPENLYGWIPTTNALMCVFLQYSATRWTRCLSDLNAIALGMLVYALGVGSVAWMRSFWGFWLSMVIMTFGELILVPRASKYVADLATEALRGRYMSLYWLYSSTVDRGRIARLYLPTGDLARRILAWVDQHSRPARTGAFPRSGQA